MFTFSASQKTYEIDRVKVGGKVGDNPTVMIGSIFYKGDKIVQDEKTGSFDRRKAEELISSVEEISDKTGLPVMLDVVCSDSKTVEKYLGFAADATRMPILIDAVSEEVALSGLDFVNELNVIDRTILNSINSRTTEQVYQKIKEVRLENVIILTYSSEAILSYRERVKLIETLIPKAEKAGIKRILVDTLVMDIATLGLACKAIYEVKNRFGYPSGCGAHNAIESWRTLKKKKDKLLNLVFTSIANGFPVAIGADFVLYGPINAAKFIFPAISLIDASYGQIMMEEGRRPSQDHPRFKISRL